jgi:hypothetical protein
MTRHRDFHLEHLHRRAHAVLAGMVRRHGLYILRMLPLLGLVKIQAVGRIALQVQPAGEALGRLGWNGWVVLGFAVDVLLP